MIATKGGLKLELCKGGEKKKRACGSDLFEVSALGLE